MIRHRLRFCHIRRVFCLVDKEVPQSMCIAVGGGIWINAKKSLEVLDPGLHEGYVLLYIALHLIYREVLNLQVWYAVVHACLG